MTQNREIKAPHYRLYIDETGDHTYKNLDDVSRRYLGLLGVIFERANDYQKAADGLRAKEITQEEYQRKKAKLLNNKKDLEAKLGEIEKTSGGWLEPATNFVTHCNMAGSVAWQGNLAAKRDFLKIFGSNFFLKDRSLTYKRAYLYDEVAKISPSQDWLPGLDDVDNNRLG